MKASAWAAAVWLALAQPLLGEEASDYGARAKETLNSCTIRTAVGPRETPLSLDQANFLLDHPALAASLARETGSAHYRVGPHGGPRSSSLDDGEGAKGFVALIESQETRRLYYGEGVYVASMMPDIHAAAVVRLTLRPVPSKTEPMSIDSSLDVCLRVKNPVLSVAVKVLRPFLRGAIRKKFARAFLAAQKIGESLRKDPVSIAAKIAAFPGLSPRDRAAARRIFGSR